MTQLVGKGFEQLHNTQHTTHNTNEQALWAAPTDCALHKIVEYMIMLVSVVLMRLRCHIGYG